MRMGRSQRTWETGENDYSTGVNGWDSHPKRDLTKGWEPPASKGTSLPPGLHLGSGVVFCPSSMCCMLFLCNGDNFGGGPIL